MHRRACSHVLPLVSSLGVVCAAPKPRRADEGFPKTKVPLGGSAFVLRTCQGAGPAACQQRQPSVDLYRQQSDDPSRVLQWHREGGGFVHENVEATQLEGLGWALCAGAGIEEGATLVTTPSKLLWIARESEASDIQPLAPGEELPGASALLRRRLVASLREPTPFVGAMRPPGSLPLQLAAGQVHEGAPEATTELLKGTSLLHHTLSLRAKLLEAVRPELELAPDPQPAWEACVWAQAVIMSRAFKIPKGTDRLVLIPIVDIANHAATYDSANADVGQNSDGSISMVARRGIEPGEEIRICYGEFTNEQLLFCYGFVLPDNPCQGLVCPLQFPDSPKRAELLHHCLKHHRRLSCGRLPAKAGPLLRRGTGEEGEGVALELLLALKVTNLSEEEAAALLRGGTWEAAESGLRLGPQEWVSALAFLEAWERELPKIPRGAALGPGSPGGPEAGPASQLQDEARRLIGEAMDELAARLPLPLYLRWRAHRAVTNFMSPLV